MSFLSINETDVLRCLSCMSVLKEEGTCPFCGYTPKFEYDIKYLRPGTMLNDGRFLVGRMATNNGENATYVCYDNKEKETCWVREYYPASISSRVPSSGKVKPDEGKEAQYKALMVDYIDTSNEIKRLQVTENVIPISFDFPENNTYYVIYKHLRVVNLETYLTRVGGKIDYDKAIDMMMPLFNMIGKIHDSGFIHRGISPFTVYVDSDDNIYLWDFALSATRTANSELECELFNGYSAPEQYFSNGWQGTWTDIFAMASLFYRVVSGFVPPKSTLQQGRQIAPLCDLVVGIPERASDAVASAMNLSTDFRVQNVFAFTSQLLETSDSGTAIFDVAKIKFGDEFSADSFASHEDKDSIDIAPYPLPIVEYEQPKPRGARQQRKPEQRPTQRRPQNSQRQRKESSKFAKFLFGVFIIAFIIMVLILTMWAITRSLFPDEAAVDSEAPQSFEDIVSSEASVSSEPALMVEVPRFVGSTLESVLGDPEYKKHFVFDVIEEHHAQFPVGVVFMQSPEEAADAEEMSTITIYVSKGPEIAQVVMPSIIGMTFDEAVKKIEESRLKYTKVERLAADSPAGSVVGSSPAPGTLVDENSEITIYVMPGEATPASTEADQESASSSKKSSESNAEDTDVKSSSSSKKSSSKSSSDSKASSKSASSSKSSSKSSSAKSSSSSN